MASIRAVTVVVVVALVVGGCRPQETLDLPGLVDVLSELGARVVELDPGDRLVPWFAGTQHRLCVDDRVVWVLDYPDPDRRAADSEGIPPDASRLGPGTLDINGRFRVWAEGKLLVFYLGLEDVVVDRLTDALGPTITPRAQPRGVFGGTVDPRRAARDYSCVSS